MGKNYWIKWFKAAGLRAVRTVAQTAAATIGTSVVISAIDWRMVISASLLAGLLSLLTSIGGLPEVPLTTEDGETNVSNSDDKGNEA